MQGSSSKMVCLLREWGILRSSFSKPKIKNKNNNTDLRSEKEAEDLHRLRCDRSSNARRDSSFIGKTSRQVAYLVQKIGDDTSCSACTAPPRRLRLVPLSQATPLKCFTNTTTKICLLEKSCINRYRNKTSGRTVIDQRLASS